MLKSEPSGTFSLWRCVRKKAYYLWGLLSRLYSVLIEVGNTWTTCTPVYSLLWDVALGHMNICVPLFLEYSVPHAGDNVPLSHEMTYLRHACFLVIGILSQVALNKYQMDTFWSGLEVSDNCSLIVIHGSHGAIIFKWIRHTESYMRILSKWSIYRIIPNKGTPPNRSTPLWGPVFLLYHVCYSCTWFSKSNITSSWALA